MNKLTTCPLTNPPLNQGKVRQLALKGTDKFSFETLTDETRQNAKLTTRYLESLFKEAYGAELNNAYIREVTDDFLSKKEEHREPYFVKAYFVLSIAWIATPKTIIDKDYAEGLSKLLDKFLSEEKKKKNLFDEFKEQLVQWANHPHPKAIALLPPIIVNEGLHDYFGERVNQISKRESGFWGLQKVWNGLRDTDEHKLIEHLQMLKKRVQEELVKKRVQEELSKRNKEKPPKNKKN